MRFLWISGWSVPPTWLASQARDAFPEATHTAVPPSEANAGIAQEKFDVLGGYSLGALWLLMHQKDFPENVPVVLLAPIISLVAEYGDGGRVALAQLRLQRRRFRQQAKASIEDFYRHSGLENILPAVGELSNEQIAALDTELSWLEEWRAAVPPPKNWRGFVGQEDPLLDAEVLQGKWPALRLVSQAGHAPGPLLRAAAQKFQVKGPR